MIHGSAPEEKSGFVKVITGSVLWLHPSVDMNSAASKANTCILILISLQVL